MIEEEGVVKLRSLGEILLADVAIGDPNLGASVTEDRLGLLLDQDRLLLQQRVLLGVR
jgi:hypothetical protein